MIEKITFAREINSQLRAHGEEASKEFAIKQGGWSMDEIDVFKINTLAGPERHLPRHQAKMNRYS